MSSKESTGGGVVGAYLAIMICCASSVYSDEVLPMHGAWTNRYRFQTTGGQSDHDLDTYFYMDTTLMEDQPWYAAVAGSGHFDLNGTTPDSIYRDIYDSFGHDQVGRLFYAYVERRDTGPAQAIRLGRQQRFEFESFTFDGLAIEMKRQKGLGLSVYGGVPVHSYENQIGFDPGDYVSGGELEISPFPNFKNRVDFVYFRDVQSPYRVQFGTKNDSLIGLSSWLDATDVLSFSGRFTAFLDQVRDLSIGTAIKSMDPNYQLRVDYYALLHESEYRVADLDTMTIAGIYKPYSEASVRGSKGIGEHFSVDMGFYLRSLRKFETASAFNHGFERASLTLNTFTWPIQGMSLSATGDYYHGDDNVTKNNTFGGSFSLTQDLAQRKYRIQAGTAYFLYRYNLFAQDESVDVQTYFVNLNAKLIKSLEGRIGYELEHNDIDVFHQTEARLTWKF